MKYLVPRTCTEIRQDSQGKSERLPLQPLENYRNTEAYILLGDPGAGKTTAFKQEKKCITDAEYVNARDFITFDDRPEWHGKTLFIDGLDEVRAGVADARNPFDAIRARLDKLGRPRFRLSCREADWFGAVDKERLADVAPDNSIIELHLDPLTEDDVAEILEHSVQAPDLANFLSRDQEYNVLDFQRNPQILSMFIDAVANENWPGTRLRTFELACQTLIREHNKNHVIAETERPVDVAAQLNAAGFLCAVQLITGKSGYALLPTVANEAYPLLGELDYGNPGLLHRVAKSKLFAGEAKRVRYVHRMIAEYLGAKYLADRVDNKGLPLGRVFALMTGEDGGVVTALRGLFAWFAVLCLRERCTLIERDPLGIVIYGDVKLFAKTDKRRILEGLKREADLYAGFRNMDWSTHPFGALCTPDMEDIFLEVLESSRRSKAHQVLVDCVLDAMEYGDRLQNLNPVLIKIIRDETWLYGIRSQALVVATRNLIQSESGIEQLTQLIVDINSGLVVDEDDGLLGVALDKLYKDVIRSSEVINYLHKPKQSNHIGRYIMFWKLALADRSSSQDIRVLLNQLVQRRLELQPVFKDISLGGMVDQLLIRALESVGEKIETSQLYEWLGIGLGEKGFHRRHDMDETQKVRAWFEAHPGIQKALFEYGISQCASQEDYDLFLTKMRVRIFEAAPPADFGAWCVDKAKVEHDEKIKRVWLEMSIRMLQWGRGTDGLSRKDIEHVARKSPDLKSWSKEMLDPTPCPEELEWEREKVARKLKEEKEKQQWVNDIKALEQKILDGSVPPGILHTFAQAYYGHLYDAKGETPYDRLSDLFAGDERLVKLAIKGLSESINRTDVPTAKQVFDLHKKGKMFYLCFPILAALNELARKSPCSILKLPEDKMRMVLAFHFTEGTIDVTGWLTPLLDSHPKLFSSTYLEYAITALRGSREYIDGLNSLTIDPAYSVVAQSVVIPLLSKFPVRCTSKQLNVLDSLLKAAYLHAEAGQFKSLIKKKLELQSMNIGQRVRWLAAGFVFESAAYQPLLVEYVQGQERRTEHLAAFLDDTHKRGSLLEHIPESGLGTLVQLLGVYCQPYTLDKAGWISPAMQAASFVRGLIMRLGASSSRESSRQIDKLLGTESLEKWKEILRDAQYGQRVARREAEFQHPSVTKAIKTLQNKEPANVADLAALTVDHLEDLATKIQQGNTDDYKQYWNLDPKGKPESPRHEDACRDTLLSDFKDRLALINVDAQPEGHYAKDKRSDIRVSFGGGKRLNVPIEIKKNTHPNLWHAIRGQLMAQYTIDPDAQGYGIYLVLWFGVDVKQPPALEGAPRPRSVEELKDRLTSLLSSEEQKKISVCVIDCTGPA